MDTPAPVSAAAVVPLTALSSRASPPSVPAPGDESAQYIHFTVPYEQEAALPALFSYIKARAGGWQELVSCSGRRGAGRACPQQRRNLQHASAA